ncbi:hypothetical protein GCM10010393_38700 [Streptomyces gobitricini]|uniref:Uncharacterized protein n=1 Tax=Streptomyces gobitricini TaxID=68211 RepID=A0ABN3MI41_9ACTN
MAAIARALLDMGVLRARIGMGGRYTGQLPYDRGHYGSTGDPGGGDVAAALDQDPGVDGCPCRPSGDGATAGAMDMTEP